MKQLPKKSRIEIRRTEILLRYHISFMNKVQSTRLNGRHSAVTDRSQNAKCHPSSFSSSSYCQLSEHGRAKQTVIHGRDCIRDHLLRLVPSSYEIDNSCEPKRDLAAAAKLALWMGKIENFRLRYRLLTKLRLRIFINRINGGESHFKVEYRISYNVHAMCLMLSARIIS